MATNTKWILTEVIQS